MIETVRHINELLQLAVFLVALIGAPIAVWKFFEDGRRQRQATADGHYQRYLERAMDYPKLSWPEGTIPSDEKYPWLVAIMLNALASQITCNPPTDMREALKADLRTHKMYLDSRDFKNEGGWSLYPTELKKLYDELI